MRSVPEGACIGEDCQLIARPSESARIGCFMHLRDLTNSHPEFAPPRAVQFVRQCEAAARERLRERQKREVEQHCKGPVS